MSVRIRREHTGNISCDGDLSYPYCYEVDYRGCKTSTSNDGELLLEAVARRVLYKPAGAVGDTSAFHALIGDCDDARALKAQAWLYRQQCVVGEPWEREIEL